MHVDRHPCAAAGTSERVEPAEVDRHHGLRRAARRPRTRGSWLRRLQPPRPNGAVPPGQPLEARRVDSLREAAPSPRARPARRGPSLRGERAPQRDRSLRRCLASCRLTASAIRCWWMPSWRSRSIARRSASAARTSLRREARSSSSSTRSRSSSRCRSTCRAPSMTTSRRLTAVVLPHRRARRRVGQRIPRRRRRNPHSRVDDGAGDPNNKPIEVSTSWRPRPLAPRRAGRQGGLA